jgi:hypothetical protein
MAKHSSRGRRPATHPTAGCADSAGHDAEAFLLAGSVMCGSWSVAGLNPELDARGGVWGWKMMRCGCRFVVLIYPAESRPSSSDISASVHTVGLAGSRRARGTQSEHPAGGKSSPLASNTASRRDSNAQPVAPSRFQSMGSEGPA